MEVVGVDILVLHNLETRMFCVPNGPLLARHVLFHLCVLHSRKFNVNPSIHTSNQQKDEDLLRLFKVMLTQFFSITMVWLVWRYRYSGKQGLFFKHLKKNPKIFGYCSAILLSLDNTSIFA